MSSRYKQQYIKIRSTEQLKPSFHTDFIHADSACAGGAYA